MNDTKAQLLRSARRLFSRGGYDGTSVRAITREARANLGAVTYHFGSKQRLYEEVLLSVTEPLVQRIDDLSRLSASPLDRVEALLRGFFEHMRQVPAMPALMLHELALNRPVPAPVRRTMGGVFRALVHCVESGQREGSIVSGDVRHLVIGVISQPIYSALAQRPLREVIGVDQNDPAGYARLVNDVVGFVRRGLQAQKGPSDA